MTTKTRKAREVHVGWSTHKTEPDTYMVYAECDDEATTLILVKPSPELAEMFLIPLEAIATSAAYQLFLLDHQDRCEPCRRWIAS